MLQVARRTLHLCVWLCALFTAGHAAAQELANDVRITAEITRNGQIDGYFFDADAGDTIYLNVADRDATNFNPNVQVFAPGGVQVASVSDLFTADVDGLVLAASGRYNVLVQDIGADNFGTYTLNYVRVTGANEGGLLTNDTQLTGTIDLGDLDTFTFTAQAGDRIHLNAADINQTNFNPDLRLHDPSGELVESATDLFTATLRDIEITETGTWTIVLGDINSDNAGDYELFYALVPGANEKGLLLNDAMHSETLVLGDIDTWTFSAAAGDTIFLNVADINNTNFNPDLLVYDPTGQLLISTADLFTADINGLEITSGGLHTVVVKDINADNAGDYDLYFARVPNANELGTLASGDVVPGSIDLGDIDTYQFGARTGAIVRLNVGELIGSSFNPSVAVYDEAGMRVASDTDLSTASLSFTAPSDGFYSVLVQDSGADNIGDYTLDFFYLGDTPPSPGRSVVIEPIVWHQLGIPGDTNANIGTLFGSVFDLGSYASAQAAQPWIIFVYESDPASGPSGVYRVPDLSETLPPGKGFWFQHFFDTAFRVNLPVGTGDATGTSGNGCVTGSSCVSIPLAQSNGNGGWVIGAVPSIQSVSPDEVRLLTDSAAPLCTAGCTLTQAFDAGLTLNGFWRYEPRTGLYAFLSGTTTIPPWQGFWSPTAPSAAIASPQLRVPVQ